MAVQFMNGFAGLQIKWDANRELEFIPYDQIKGLKNGPVTTSAFYNGKREKLKYDYEVIVSVKNNLVDLKYEKDPNLFVERGWESEFGTTKIEFFDLKRDKIKSIVWIPANKKIRSHEPDYKLTTRKDAKKEFKRDKKKVSVWDRKGQAKFKAELNFFDKKCVISDTSLYDVLQAAHIRPVKHFGPDDAENGILIRADLHILFDNGSISILQKTGSIKVGSTAKAYLKGQSIRKNIGKETLSRVRKALEWKWRNSG